MMSQYNVCIYREHFLPQPKNSKVVLLSTTKTHNFPTKAELNIEIDQYRKELLYLLCVSVSVRFNHNHYKFGFINQFGIRAIIIEAIKINV